MDILREYGVEANIEYEDYVKGLKASARPGRAMCPVFFDFPGWI
jgi:hypothetical protein